MDRIDSGCTLIVCPKSILQQWVEEIEKHLKDVKVFVYDGIKSNKGTSKLVVVFICCLQVFFAEFIFPPSLAQNDIVLTTYDILRSEIDFTKTFEYDHLRGSKRYYSPVSPLLSVNWWRLCFDEAQLVEGTFTRAAQMANVLTSTYRWAITGTPIQSTINDLYGLLYFIGEQPFCHKPIWNSSLYQPYCFGLLFFG